MILGFVLVDSSLYFNSTSRIGALYGHEGVLVSTYTTILLQYSMATENSARNSFVMVSAKGKGPIVLWVAKGFSATRNEFLKR